MYKRIFYLILLISSISYSQNSTISIDSGNHNDINIIQEGQDSSMIKLNKSDSNKIQLHQNRNQNAIHKSSRFFVVMTFIGTILSNIISLIAIFEFVKKIRDKKRGQ